MKGAVSYIFEFGKIAVVALVVVVALRMFVFQPFLVRGASMEPNFHNFDYLIVDEISYRFKEPERGEVIVFRFPNDPSQRYIKRIIGLPGETIEVAQGVVTISGEQQSFVLDESSYLPGVTTGGSAHITLRNNEYFVLGDNRQYSSDSRAWGVLPKEHIIGRTLIRVFPVSAFAKVEPPIY